MPRSIQARELSAVYRGEKFKLLFRQKCALCCAFREKVNQVTMTFGLAYSVDGLRIEDVIRDADEKLYAGKHSGKNRVVDDKHMVAGKEGSS